jgi:hypothetical protein
VHKTTRGDAEIKQKEESVGGNITRTNKWTDRVKGQNLILKLWAGLDGSPGSKNCARKIGKNTANHELEYKHVQN